MLTLYTSKLALLNDQQRPNIHLIQDANAYFNQKVRKGEIQHRGLQADKENTLLR